MDVNIDRIERLKKQKNEIDARIARERAVLNKKKRKEDTRRKILIGAATLAALKNGKLEQSSLDWLLNTYVKTPRDRKFLGLPDGDRAAVRQTREPSNTTPLDATASGQNAPQAERKTQFDHIDL